MVKRDESTLWQRLDQAYKSKNALAFFQALEDDRIKGTQMGLSRYEKVRLFMQHIGQAVPGALLSDMKDYPCELRARLVLEEALEFVDACGRNSVDFEPVSFHNRNTLTPDRTKAVDGLIDILVVTYGALAALGLSEAQVDELFDEVNETNEAKVYGPVNEFGKKLKPPGWKPPRIAEILQKYDSDKMPAQGPTDCDK